MISKLSYIAFICDAHQAQSAMVTTGYGTVKFYGLARKSGKVLQLDKATCFDLL